jgi:DnaK suppressor protein
MPPKKKVPNSTKKTATTTKSKKTSNQESEAPSLSSPSASKKKPASLKKAREVAKNSTKSAKTKPNKKTSSSSKKAKVPQLKKIGKEVSSSRAVDSPFKNFNPYELKKNEVFMSDGQLGHFRQILLSWRQELMEEVDRTMNHMQEEAINYPDPTDRAAQEEEFSIELKTRDRERRLIKKIDQTIERIDQEDYGYCDTCGIEIGLRRLEARPTANQCIDCKSHDELRERQLHG